MKFLNIIYPLALVAITPTLAQEVEDMYELGARDADPFSIKFNPVFGDVRKGKLGNPDEVKSKKKGDEASGDADGNDDDSNDAGGDDSEGKKRKKKNKDRKLLERALYIRDLMDEFLEERDLDEDYLYLD